MGKGTDQQWGGQTVKPLEHVLVAGGGSWRFGGVEVFGSFLLEGLRVFKAKGCFEVPFAVRVAVSPHFLGQLRLLGHRL